MDTQQITFALLLVTNSIAITAVFLKALSKNREDLKDYIINLTEQIKNEYVKDVTCSERRVNCPCLREIQHLQDQIKK